MRTLTRILATTLAAAIPMVGISAQSITSITAEFDNAVPGTVSINNTNLDGIMVCWPGSVDADCSSLGTATNLSGYLFERATTPFEPGIGNAFALGTFTHFNYPITSTALSSVDLIFSFSIAGATPSTFGDTWTLSHNETPNSGNCQFAGGDPCADRVSFAIAGGGGPTPFQYDGKNYILSLFGFGATAESASQNPAFITFENQANPTQLWARITEVPPTSTVPEPATMTLLATGLAGMAAARRRRKA